VTRRRSGALVDAALIGVAFVGAFLLYFMIYRVRHFELPLGFDAPWYVWRTDFVSSLGIGPLDTTARPGTALLSATLHSLTGLSGLELEVVLPFVLVALFAVTVATAVWEGLAWGDRWRWTVPAAVSAGLLGTTRLVGENVANLLNLVLVVGGLFLLVRFVTVGRGFIGAVLMLLAAGLAHWLFLSVFAVVAAVWFALALPSSRRAMTAGTPLWRTESGGIASATAVTVSGMAGLIYGVLDTSYRTFEIHEAKRRFIPKLREDLGALQVAFTGPATALGIAALVDEERRNTSPPIRGTFLRLTAAWAVVALGGLAVTAATKALPPHRFLTLFVALPMVVAIAGAVVYAVRWVADRGMRFLPAVAGIVAVGLLTVPAMFAWYGGNGPQQFFDATAFQQAREASLFVDALPERRPVVFVVSPIGPFGPISTAQKERTIRAAMPPDRQESVHVFPGEPGDLLAGRRTLVASPDVNRENLTYWQDVRPVLASHPPVVVLEELGEREFQEAAQNYGATKIAPGVLVIPSGATPQQVARLGELHPVPPTEVGLGRAVALAFLLGVAGLGWASWSLGPGSGALTILSLAPAAGAAVLILGALATVKAGFALGGAAGIATYAAVTVLGGALALGSRVRRDRRKRG
jgi:hypothetical protein